MTLIATGIGGFRAYQAANAYQRSADEFLEAVRSRDLVQARSRVARLERDADTLRDITASPLLSPGSWVPWIRRDFRAVRRVGAAAPALTVAASEGLAALEHEPPGGWVNGAGRVDLVALGRAGASLNAARDAAADALRTVAGAEPAGVVPTVSGRYQRALSEIEKAEVATSRAAAGMEFAHDLLRDGSLAVVFSNLAELRGVGGLPGAMLVVEFADGKISRRGDLIRPTDDLPPPNQLAVQVPDWWQRAYEGVGAFRTWQNVNLASDWSVPTLLFEAALRQRGQSPDAIALIDPVGLSALLGATGAVEVAGWDTPISAENVTAVTQNLAYVRFADDKQARVDFLGRVAAAVFDRISAGGAVLNSATFEAFGAAVSGGHLVVDSSHPETHRLLTGAGVTHPTDRSARRQLPLGIITHNAGGNKLDWYLERDIHADIRANDDELVVAVSAVLTNDAPPDGLPEYVNGSVIPGLPRSVNRVGMSIVHPAGSTVTGVQIAGEDRAFDVHDEGGVRVSRLPLFDIGPKSNLSVDFEISLPVTRIKGEHQLVILHQPTINPDNWTIQAEGEDAYSVEPKKFEGAVHSDTTVEVRVSRNWWKDFLVWLDRL